MKNRMEISIDMSFMNYKKGSIITVKSKDGIPLDKFWRDRLKDSEFDGCVSIVKRTRNQPVKKATRR